MPLGEVIYSLVTRQGTKQFCCEGCQGIYRMLHEADILDNP